MDGVRQDLEGRILTNREERIQDCDYWRLMIVAAKTLNRILKLHDNKIQQRYH